MQIIFNRYKNSTWEGVQSSKGRVFLAEDDKHKESKNCNGAQMGLYLMSEKSKVSNEKLK